MLFIYFVGKKSKKRPFNQPSVGSKCIYILYSNDNIFHQNVIGHFANFLSKVCSCQVIYDVDHRHDILDKTEWIRQAMEQADYILVINSEGSGNKSVVMLQHSTYYVAPDCDSGVGDMFAPAFSLLLHDALHHQQSLKHKLILTHFSYTMPQYRLLHLPNLHDKKNYQLMKDIEYLYGHIHGSDCHDVTDVTYQETEEGLLLSQCIEDATGYVESNPRWFAETHGSSQPWAVPAYQIIPPLSIASESMFNELDRINNSFVEESIAWSGTEIQRTNTRQVVPPHLRQTVPFGTGNNSPGLSVKLVPLATGLKIPPKPDDTTTLSSSAMGDLIDDINDSGYDRMESYINPNKNSSSV